MATRAAKLALRGKALSDTGTEIGIVNNADATAITIDSSENVGIGTSSPTAPLHIVGGTSSISSIQLDGGTASNDNSSIQSKYSLYLNADSGASIAGRSIILGVSGAEAMRINSSGNVFIGDSTTAVTSKLVVSGNGTTDVATFMNDGQAGTYLDIDCEAANGAVVLRADARTGSYPPLTFKTSNTERMRIDSSGNVCIGSSDAGNAGSLNLSVGVAGSTAGGLQLWAGNGSNHYVQFGDSTSSNGPYRGALGYQHSVDAMVMFTAGSEAMRIDSSGNVLVGKTASAGTTAGIELRPAGLGVFSVTGDYPLQLRRLGGTDGDLTRYYKDSTFVGSINTGTSRIGLRSGDTGIMCAADLDAIYPQNDLAGRDAAIDLGVSGARFKDLYLSGGVYLGGTGSANLLDDYEEGTWTPTSTGNVLNVGRASYTKVGRMVTLDFSFSFSGNASDATLFKIENLPFASSGTGSESQGTVMLSYASFGAGKSPSLYKYTGDNHISIFLTGHGVSWLYVLNNMISASTSIIGQITYPID